MKKSLILTMVMFSSACAGSTNDERTTAEQRERAAEQRAEQRENQNEPIPSEFDRDGDGEVESAELKQAGVMDEAADSIVAEQHSEEPSHQSDAQITAKIREKLIDYDNLSARAKSVRVSTTNGKVTLQGPVETAEEKATVESCAKEVSGSDVDNRLQVAR